MESDAFIRTLLMNLSGGNVEVEFNKRKKEDKKDKKFRRAKLLELEKGRLSHIQKLKNLGWGLEEDILMQSGFHPTQIKARNEERKKAGLMGEEEGIWTEAKSKAQRGLGMTSDEAYCVKCKERVEIEDPEEVMTKNHRRMLQGLCPNCGTKVCRFLSSSSE
jgi:hypothetical protein